MRVLGFPSGRDSCVVSAAGQMGMREPNKRQGSVLKETSSSTRKRGRDAANLSAEQGIAMHCLNFPSPRTAGESLPSLDRRDFSVGLYVCAGRRACCGTWYVARIHTHAHPRTHTHTHIHTYIYVYTYICIYIALYIHRVKPSCSANAGKGQGQGSSTHKEVLTPHISPYTILLLPILSGV